MARDIQNKKQRKGPSTGHSSKYLQAGSIPKARLDLGAESPNWRDHPNDHSKTAVPIHVNETVCQFLYNGWYEHESKVATIGGYVEVIGEEVSCPYSHEEVLNAEKWFNLLKQHKGDVH